MMRPLALAFVVLVVIGCSSSSTGNSGGAQSSGSGGATSGFGGQNGAGGSGTCDGACAHYLGCKNIDTPDNRTQCTDQCASLNLTPDQLANYEATDCQTAIAAIDGNGGSSGSSGGGTTDCKGCAWDGSSCIYLTGSNGSYFPCDSVCCPGH
jgi:hypothetical protein